MTKWLKPYKSWNTENAFVEMQDAKSKSLWLNPLNVSLTSLENGWKSYIFVARSTSYSYFYVNQRHIFDKVEQERHI